MSDLLTVGPARGSFPGWSPAQGRPTRRALVRGAAAALGAAATGSSLAALGPAVGAGAAAPRAAAANSTVISVHLHLAGPTFGWPPTPAVAALIREALAPLVAQHPGLVIKFFPQSDNWQGWQASTQGSMLAGVGPDIFADWELTGYPAAGLCLDLQPYVERDNVDLGVYQSGQIRYIRQAGLLSPTKPIQLMALPQYPYPEAMAVNLGILDDLGLKYPEPNWTYKDWQRLWEASVQRPHGNNPGRMGTDMSYYADFWDGYDFSYNLPGAWVLYGWGGEYVDPNDQTRSWLDNPNSIAAAEWCFDLIYNKVVASDQTQQMDFAKGQLTTYMLPAAYLPIAATQYRGLKWDLFPLPIWPKVAATYTSTDSLGIWSGTKYPDAAWEVLKWISYGKTWQRMQARITLQAPSRRDMTEEWIQIVRQVAPPLRDKNLEVWVQQAEANHEYMGYLFRYGESDVQNALSTLSSQLFSRKVTVAEGFTQAARRIDAIERADRTISAEAGRALAIYKTTMAAALTSPNTYRFPAPARTGFGAPPADARAQVSERTGVWTVTGGGKGIQGSSDGGTYACAAFTGTQGTFTCRLTALRALKPNTLHDGAKIGLMVRGDLSDNAPSLGVEVSAGRGIHAHVRTAPGGSIGDQRPGVSWNDQGLLPAKGLLADDTKPAKNYLLRPVWLRVVREVNRWVCLTSLDGAHWMPAGPPFATQILGAWVGLFVSAHNSGSLVQATFDQLQGFTPDTFVRIGAP